MRKRAPTEKVEPYRQRDHKNLGHALRDKLAAWAHCVREAAAECRPNLPIEIVDRKADVWEPLIVVADLAGGSWPAKAREAALHFVAASKTATPSSLGIRLLRDIQACFGQDQKVRTKDLLERLLADQEAPWGDLRGKKLNDRKLAELLRPYGIGSEGLRMADGSTPKGYKRQAFHDAWHRYLTPPQAGATGATSATANGKSQIPNDPSVADETPCCGDVAEAASENLEN
nr:DUF3631 domain-containing protein [Sphingomonas anseongensis]